MTIEAFQFILASQYFPRSINDVLNAKEGLYYSLLSKIIEEKVQTHKMNTKKLGKHLSAIEKKRLANDYELIETFAVKGKCFL
jgi:hypothetical protein